MLRKDGFKVELYDPFFFKNSNVFLRKFNYITCTEVIEHFHKPYKEFIKIDNLLAKNSWFAIMTAFMTKNNLFENWHYTRDPTYVVFYKKLKL